MFVIVCSYVPQLFLFCLVHQVLDFVIIDVHNISGFNFFNVDWTIKNAGETEKEGERGEKKKKRRG